MQSLFIVGKNTEKLKDEAQNICKENNISKFDVEIISAEKSVGIDDIKTLQRNLFLAPVGGRKKAAVLEAFYGMTIQAQNAFLKILEEPPESTIIMTLVTSTDFILSTVLSRCRIISLEKTRKLTQDEIYQNLKILSGVKNNPSEALLVAQDNSQTRETALFFLENMIISVHENLDKTENAAKILRKMQKTHTIIKTTNVSPRFALENLFLNI